MRLKKRADFVRPYTVWWHKSLGENKIRHLLFRAGFTCPYKSVNAQRTTLNAQRFGWEVLKRHD